MGLRAVTNPAAGGQPGSFTTLTVTGAATIGGGLAVTGIQTITANSASAALRVVQSGAGPAAAFTGGNVLIGTTINDVYRLDVNGSFRAGNSTFGNMDVFGTQAITATSSSAALNVAQSGSGPSINTSSFIQGTEQTAPSAPAANGYRIFAQDNGAGKTQLMVIFASGAAQQIAIEP